MEWVCEDIHELLVKAEVHMNRSEIWSDIKRETLPDKEPPTPHPPKKGESCRLVRVHLLIIHFIFQFSKSIKSSTFHIFLFHIFLFLKMPKSRLKIYTKPQNSRLHAHPSLKSSVVSSFQITKFTIGSTKVTVSVVKVAVQLALIILVCCSS